MMLTFKEFSEANARRAPGFVNRKGETFAPFTPLETCGAAAGELGELANLVKKVRRGDQTLDEARQKIADEVGDVVTYLTILCNKLDIDIGEACRSKFNEVSDRIGSDIKIGRSLQ